MISTCFKHQKRNLHEGLTILTSPQTKWQAFENAMCTFDTPPPFLGLRVKICFQAERESSLVANVGSVKVVSDF